eukprot:66932_1
MGRRKRCRDDDYDDSVEKAFFASHQTAEEKQQAAKEESNQGKEKSAEDYERLRNKKKAKKERQKQKKLEARLEAEEKNRQSKKIAAEVQELKEKKKERKLIEKTKPSPEKFIKTHKGVKYCDILKGTGPMIEDRKKVRVKYILRAKDKEGKVIDKGSNFGFSMGKGEVISGWEIGLLRMKQGGIRHIIVPPAAGYGTKDIGGGNGCLLYFEVTLLKC